VTAVPALRSRLSALLGAALLASFPGCSSGPRSLDLDLLRRAPDLVSPTRLIRPGDEATRQLLEAGFSLADEQWVVGPAVERLVFGFHVTVPAELRVAFRGEGSSAFEAAATVNDVPIGALSFPSGRAEAALSVPAGTLRPGFNTMSLELPAAPVPRFRMRSVVLGDGVEPVRWSSGDAPAVLQAAGSEASWLLEPVGDRLELSGSLAGCVASPCAVALLAETDRQPRRALWHTEVRGASGRVEAAIGLQGWTREPLRLTARFASGPAGAALTWTRLRVTGPPSAVRPATAASAARDRPNVLVFMVDTLRRDHLSVYGYGRPTSPELERFAAGAVVFEDAWTQSSWTSPTVASLFTGEHPSAHAIRDHHVSLAPGFVTLAEHLQQRGYRTSGLVVNPGVGKRGGFEQGFEEYRFLPLANAEEVVGEALARTTGGPWFLYLHLMDTHYPYTKAPPPFDALVLSPEGVALRPEALSIAKLRRRKLVPTPAELSYLRSLYDSEIAYVDHAFGRLLQGLRQRGLHDGALIVFISDHGEEFADHGGYYHGHSLYSELTRAAMLVKPPGRIGPRTARAPAQTVDVYPTIAAAVGAPRDDLPGRNLWPLLSGAAAAEDPGPVFSETELRARLRSIVVGGHKLVLEDRREAGLADLLWLYDLAADPEERVDRRMREPLRTEYLAATLRRHLELTRRRSAGAERRALDPETIRELQALGYVDAGS
jgi:arylsulfatase A-like enzyme